jgi:hypothetical protein
LTPWLQPVWVVSKAVSKWAQAHLFVICDSMGTERALAAIRRATDRSTSVIRDSQMHYAISPPFDVVAASSRNVEEWRSL